MPDFIGSEINPPFIGIIDKVYIFQAHNYKKHPKNLLLVVTERENHVHRQRG